MSEAPSLHVRISPVIFRERKSSEISRMNRSVWLRATQCLLILLVATSVGAEESRKKPVKIPPPLEFYKGRRIAQTMHYLGAEWLIRDEREREERCSLMLASLGVK